MLTNTDLEKMRSVQELALPDSATRTRYVRVPDGMGGYTTTSSTANYSCRIAPTSGNELELASRLTSAVSYTVTLPHDADVVADDMLTISGRTLRVIAVLHRAAWATVTRVLAVEA